MASENLDEKFYLELLLAVKNCYNKVSDKREAIIAIRKALDDVRVECFSSPQLETAFDICFGESQ